MIKTSMLLTAAAVFCSASAYAQSATPIEGNPTVPPTPSAPPASTGAAREVRPMPNAAAGGLEPGTANPDRAPPSHQRRCKNPPARHLRGGDRRSPPHLQGVIGTTGISMSFPLLLRTCLEGTSFRS
jgi:hypothetical protein